MTQTLKIHGLCCATLMISSLAMFVSGCGQNAAEAVGDKPVVVINKLQRSAQDLKQDPAMAGRMPHGSEEPSAGQEPLWINQIIERELLVQEAQRLGLDRERDFMLSIERFWKEALIKLLLDRKGREIGDQLHVYEPEIESSYQQLLEEDAGLPVASLAELRDEISRNIRRDKAEEAMEKWIEDLRAKAHITIDQEGISQLKGS